LSLNNEENEMKKMLLALIATTLFATSALAAPTKETRDVMCMPFPEFLQNIFTPDGFKVQLEMPASVDPADGGLNKSVDVLVDPNTKRTLVVEVTRAPGGTKLSDLTICILAAFTRVG
jgi:hypothetical protein